MVSSSHFPGARAGRRSSSSSRMLNTFQEDNKHAGRRRGVSSILLMMMFVHYVIGQVSVVHASTFPSSPLADLPGRSARGEDGNVLPISRPILTDPWFTPQPPEGLDFTPPKSFALLDLIRHRLRSLPEQDLQVYRDLNCAPPWENQPLLEMFLSFWDLDLEQRFLLGGDVLPEGDESRRSSQSSPPPSLRSSSSSATPTSASASSLLRYHRRYHNPHTSALESIRVGDCLITNFRRWRVFDSNTTPFPIEDLGTESCAAGEVSAQAAQVETEALEFDHKTLLWFFHLIHHPYRLTWGVRREVAHDGGGRSAPDRSAPSYAFWGKN